jgi:hypothetical protein
MVSHPERNQSRCVLLSFLRGRRSLVVASTGMLGFGIRRLWSRYSSKNKNAVKVGTHLMAESIA